MYSIKDFKYANKLISDYMKSELPIDNFDIMSIEERSISNSIDSVTDCITDSYNDSSETTINYIELNELQIFIQVVYKNTDDESIGKIIIPFLELMAFMKYN